MTETRKPELQAELDGLTVHRETPGRVGRKYPAQ